MGRTAHAYPQVEPGAGAVATVPTRPLPPGITVDAALAQARGGPEVWVTGAEALALREDLVRAQALGLGRLPAAVLAQPVPVTHAETTEVAVRRHLAAGDRAVLVRRRREAPRVAIVAPGTLTPGPPMRRLLGALAPERREVLAVVARLAAEARTQAWLVGGLVRDLLDGAVPARVDIDVVVGRSALVIAERLAEATAGRLVVHPRFLTASVDVPTVGVVDVVTARTEQYATPGALPRVARAGIRADLHRRDFTVNAMAIELTTEDHTLLDPFGGRRDLAAHRLRILHPLSFVEDPTRILRAARYTARLGATPDAWTRRCRRLALGLVPYPALSGARLLAELERIVDDRRPELALRALGAAGAFRLFDARYRFVRRTRERFAGFPVTLAWALAHDLGLRALDLALVAVLADQPPAVREAALDRLGLSGDPRRDLERAWTVAATTSPSAPPSARAAELRGISALGLAALHLGTADARVRATLDWWVTVGRRAGPELGGEDLLALGVPRGPAVARALAVLRDARIDGTVTDRRGEIACVQRWLETEKEG